MTRCSHHQSLSTYKYCRIIVKDSFCALRHASLHTVSHLIVDCPTLAPLRQQNISQIQQLWLNQLMGCSCMVQASWKGSGEPQKKFQQEYSFQEYKVLSL